MRREIQLSELGEIAREDPRQRQCATSPSRSPRDQRHRPLHHQRQNLRRCALRRPNSDLASPLAYGIRQDRVIPTDAINRASPLSALSSMDVVFMGPNRDSSDSSTV